MAKAKLVLTPNPTFKAKVAIPVPGAGTTEVEFTFKHRNRDAYKEFMEKIRDLEDVELIMALTCGWELSDPFDDTSVGLLVQEYISAPLAILNKYIEEQTGHRAKN